MTELKLETVYILVHDLCALLSALHPFSSASVTSSISRAEDNMQESIFLLPRMPRLNSGPTTQGMCFYPLGHLRAS